MIVFANGPKALAARISSRAGSRFITAAAQSAGIKPPPDGSFGKNGESLGLDCMGHSFFRRFAYHPTLLCRPRRPLFRRRSHPQGNGRRQGVRASLLAGEFASSLAKWPGVPLIAPRNRSCAGHSSRRREGENDGMGRAISAIIATYHMYGPCV